MHDGTFLRSKGRDQHLSIHLLYQSTRNMLYRKGNNKGNRNPTHMFALQNTYVLLNISKSLILLILEFRRNRLIWGRKEENENRLIREFILRKKQKQGEIFTKKWNTCVILKVYERNEYILLLNILVASLLSENRKKFRFLRGDVFKISTQNAQSLFHLLCELLIAEGIRWCRRTLSVVYWHFGVAPWNANTRRDFSCHKDLHNNSFMTVPEKNEDAVEIASGIIRKKAKALSAMVLEWAELQGVSSDDMQIKALHNTRFLMNISVGQSFRRTQ